MFRISYVIIFFKKCRTKTVIEIFSRSANPLVYIKKFLIKTEFEWHFDVERADPPRPLFIPCNQYSRT